METKCIQSQGSFDAYGYGRVWIKGKLYFEHRVVFSRAYPKVKIDGKIIHHVCRNTKCVNPKHLEALTRKQHAKEHGLQGIAKAHSERVVCKLGHVIDGENKKQRFCLTCKRIAARDYARRNKERNLAYNREWRKRKKIISR